MDKNFFDFMIGLLTPIFSRQFMGIIYRNRKTKKGQSCWYENEFAGLLAGGLYRMALTEQHFLILRNNKTDG